MQTREEKLAYNRKWRSENKDYFTTKSLKDKRKEYNKKNKEKFKKYFKDRYQRIKNMTGVRESELKRRYGITLDKYNDMFTFQEGKCLTCSRHQSELKHALCVDHCHATGKVRGLLCKKCNTVLGFVNDDISILKTMIKYLENE